MEMIPSPKSEAPAVQHYQQEPYNHNALHKQDSHPYSNGDPHRVAVSYNQYNVYGGTVLLEANNNSNARVEEVEEEEDAHEFGEQYASLNLFEPFLSVGDVRDSDIEVKIGLGEATETKISIPLCSDCNSKPHKNGKVPIVYTCSNDECAEITEEPRILCRSCEAKEYANVDSSYHKPTHAVHRWQPTWSFDIPNTLKEHFAPKKLVRQTVLASPDAIQSASFTPRSRYEARVLRLFLPAPSGPCAIKLSIQVEPIESAQRKHHFRDHFKLSALIGTIGASAFAWPISALPIDSRNCPTEPQDPPGKGEKLYRSRIDLKRESDLTKAFTIDLQAEIGDGEGVEVALQDIFYKSETHLVAPFRWTLNKIEITSDASPEHHAPFSLRKRYEEKAAEEDKERRKENLDQGKNMLKIAGGIYLEHRGRKLRRDDDGIPGAEPNPRPSSDPDGLKADKAASETVLPKADKPAAANKPHKADRPPIEERPSQQWYDYMSDDRRKSVRPDQLYSPSDQPKNEENFPVKRNKSNRRQNEEVQELQTPDASTGKPPRHGNSPNKQDSLRYHAEFRSGRPARKDRLPNPGDVRGENEAEYYSERPVRQDSRTYSNTQSRTRPERRDEREYDDRYDYDRGPARDDAEYSNQQRRKSKNRAEPFIEDESRSDGRRMSAATAGRYNEQRPRYSRRYTEPDDDDRERPSRYSEAPDNRRNYYSPAPPEDSRHSARPRPQSYMSDCPPRYDYPEPYSYTVQSSGRRPSPRNDNIVYTDAPPLRKLCSQDQQGRLSIPTSSAQPRRHSVGVDSPVRLARPRYEYPEDEDRYRYGDGGPARSKSRKASSSRRAEPDGSPERREQRRPSRSPAVPVKVYRDDEYGYDTGGRYCDGSSGSGRPDYRRSASGRRMSDMAYASSYRDGGYARDGRRY